MRTDPPATLCFLRDRVSSPWGAWVVEFVPEGLLSLWPEEFAPPASVSTRDQSLPQPWRNFLRAQLHLGSALEILRPDGEKPPLLLEGTPFQQSVWSYLQQIPRGEVRTYQQVAIAIGRPGASRAVGTACGANPLPVIVPCHRVLAANRRIGGFTWGAEWKRRLLAAEGVAVA